MRVASKRAFTLLEILIVLAIMGILAGIVVPQFTRSSDDARYASTVQNLQYLRGRIDLFRNEHEGRLPGAMSDLDPDTTFRDHMILPTNEAGTTGAFADPTFPYGPYIHNQLPANPFNGSRTVQNVGTFPATAPGGDTGVDPGWIFERTSGRFKINKTGNAPDGTPYWHQ
jgi:prepilin-type N-terminal cleavage/methylation domain-containing protein